MTRRGYRWLDADGEPVSPLHRTATTAANWLARQAIEPRIRPRPRMLVGEEIGYQHASRPRRWPLLDIEVRDLIAGVTLSQVPLSARGWLGRILARTSQRRRRRMATRRLTSQLRAGVR